VTYTRGLDLSLTLQGAGGIGGLLSRSQNVSGVLQQNFYHADGNGNITAMMNYNQQIVARYIYDPYGRMIGMNGHMADANLYRFSSKELHENSELYYYGYRFYDSNLGRWLNRDPLGEKGGINLYQFGLNDTVNNIDTDGRFVQVAGGVAVGRGISIGASLLINKILYDQWTAPEPDYVYYSPLPLPNRPSRRSIQPKTNSSHWDQTCRSPNPNASPQTSPEPDKDWDYNDPTHREDLRNCEWDAIRSGKQSGTKEFDDFIEQCMRKKNYRFPPYKFP
jgi:RHS repeat-associated protein